MIRACVAAVAVMMGSVHGLAAEEAYVQQPSALTRGVAPTVGPSQGRIATPTDFSLAKSAMASTGFQPSNVAQVYQVGVGNSATVAQTGGGNVAGLVQQGQGNVAVISQTGRGR
ncbi:curlin repeat-containing protein [Methylobacterium aerolatum]|uniref:Uncharacterized protein n=1 Tax=Methylobacterium aerolatum TaxID=418708 RepID=A0ABU0HUT5_9HYPH|nr:curlin repeat-containing protein [Methylobacterium aerolatum]MDQ0446089.1 hypothetical protein [Methylobacterium aerolatum]GJD35125.1 hypothetical protein FMGBMHLM_2033 [Methylobacterium aerolatum]